MALPFYAFPIKCYFKMSLELTISRYYFISMEVSLLYCYQWIHSSIVLIRNRLNEPLVRQRIRPRRNRKSEAVRAMIRENIVTPKCVLSYDSKRLTFEEGFKKLFIVFFATGISFILYLSTRLTTRKKFLQCLIASASVSTL